MNNTVTSESFSDHRQSISDAGGVNLDASRQKCQPVRINQLMTSYSSSSEEDEENDNNKNNKNKTSPGKNNKKIISPPSHTVSQQMTSGFTSDFAKIDIDSTTNTTTSSSSSSSLSGFLNRIPLAAATAVPLLLPSSSSQQISHSDTSSHHHPPQDGKHIQGKVIYKAENPLPNNHCHQSLINKIGRVGQQQQQLVNDGSNSVIDIETPMKHQPPAGSMRPIPSSSHRNIFQTPQGKVMPSDISYQHHSNNAQTPATILSSLHNNLMRTPLQPRTLDSQQTTTGPLNISKQQQQQQNPWQINEVEKRVRKPLAETTPSHHPIPTVGVIPATPSHQQQQHETLPPPPAVTPAVTSPDNQKVQQSNLEFKENHHPSSKPQQQRNNKPIVQATVSSSSSNQKQPRVGDIFIIKKRRYMMLGSLGQGMSGSVYRVQDIETLELRAIKCVNLTLMEKDAAQSCIQEIKLLVKLQAPCIIRMYDYEIRDSIIYTVMEMGDTDLSKFLKEITAEKKRLPLTMILYYWSEMLTAVKHIHENGVIHSDLKPANFLLVRGRLKLIDFGISSTINADMTSVVKNSTVGTLNYISPEALKGIDDNVDGTSPSSEYKYKINFKSDVWSLGCILYSMVFGRTPFQNIRNQYGKINAIINPDIQISFKLPESTTTDSIPQILIDVLQSCLQRNPKSRPSVDQLLQVQYFKSGIESGGGGGGRNGNGGTLPDIPQKTLRKIKQALQDDEWREFINNMEKMRYN